MIHGPHLWKGYKKSYSAVFLKVVTASMVAIGVSRAGWREDMLMKRTLKRLQKAQTVPIVAVHESRYIEKEDAFAYEVAEAIRTGYKLNDPLRPANRYKDAYVPEE